MQLDNSIVSTAFNAIISAAVGAGVTVIGFRERLSLLKQQVDRNERDAANDKNFASAAMVEVRRDFQALCGSLSERAEDSRKADRELFERLYREGQKAFDASERRQRYVMELVTAIAKKSGIHHRLTDILLATPSEEET